MTIQDALDALTAGGIGFTVVKDSGDEFPLSLAEAAVRYAEWGWPVFPLRIGEKIPWPGSRGFEDATTDVNVVRGWWTKQPACNIGIRTGVMFDAIDVDYKHGAGEWWPAMSKHEAMPEFHGQARTTTDGLHVFVKPSGEGNNTKMFGIDGLDYRGIGGYIVGAPSVIGDRAYSWDMQPTKEIRR